MDLTSYYSNECDLDFEEVGEFVDNSNTPLTPVTDDIEVNYLSEFSNQTGHSDNGTNHELIDTSGVDARFNGLLINQGHENQAALVLVALLEELCDVYSFGDRLHSSKLFSELGKVFVNIGIIDKFLFNQESTEIHNYMRENIREYFTHGRQKIQDHLFSNPSLAFSNQRINRLLSFPNFDIGTYSFMQGLKEQQNQEEYETQQQSVSLVRNNLITRYYKDFIQVSVLGKGGFGSVFHVINKIDGNHYAIKKIVLRTVKVKCFQKIMREVKLLSRLHHPHVVGYYSSWIEIDTLPQTHQNESAMRTLTIGDSSERVLEVVDQSSAGSKYMDFSFDHSNDNIKKTDIIESSSTSSTSTSSRQLSGSIADSMSFETTSMNDSSNPLKLVKRNTSVEYINTPATSLYLFIQMQLCEYTLADWIRARNDSLCSFNKNTMSSDTYSFAKLDNFRFELAYANQKKAVCSITISELFTQILKGVEYIHNTEIVHRDLKPANIFFTDDMNIKVGDFGLARTYNDTTHPNGHIENTNVRADKSRISRSDHTSGVGTSVYASPEQLKSIIHTGKADIFSLGLILIELVYPMNSGMERAKVLKEAREGRLPSLLELHNPGFCKIINWMTSTNPSDRPSAKELLLFIDIQHHNIVYKELTLNQQDRSDHDCRCCTNCNLKIQELTQQVKLLQAQVYNKIL